MSNAGGSENVKYGHIKVKYISMSNSVQNRKSNQNYLTLFFFLLGNCCTKPMLYMHARGPYEHLGGSLKVVSVSNANTLTKSSHAWCNLCSGCNIMCWIAPPASSTTCVLIDDSSYMTHRPRPRNRWNIISVFMCTRIRVRIRFRFVIVHVCACGYMHAWLPLQVLAAPETRIRRQSKLIPRLVLCEMKYIYIFFRDRYDLDG